MKAENYDHHIIDMPWAQCPWAGLGYIGEAGVERQRIFCRLGARCCLSARQHGLLGAG